MNISLGYKEVDFPGGSDGKSICLQCGRPGFDPWVGKIHWRKKWQPLQYSCLENPTDRGAWQAIVHEVAKSRTRLSNFTSLLLFTLALKSFHCAWAQGNYA